MEKCVFFWSSCGYTGPPETSLGLLSSDSPVKFHLDWTLESPEEIKKILMPRLPPRTIKSEFLSQGPCQLLSEILQEIPVWNWTWCKCASLRRYPATKSQNTVSSWIQGIICLSLTAQCV